MMEDGRITIVVDYDGASADVTVSMLRRRGTLPNESQSVEFTCDSEPLGDDALHEAFMVFQHACVAIMRQR
jgi:hypothetical protein